MFYPLEIFIGLRYTRAKRRNHFISFISLSSMLGIALGITALITVLSVMNGFQKEVRSRILGMTAHATISDWSGSLADWQTVRDSAIRYPQVLAGAPFAGQRRYRSGHITGRRRQGFRYRKAIHTGESERSKGRRIRYRSGA